MDLKVVIRQVVVLVVAMIIAFFLGWGMSYFVLEGRWEDCWWAMLIGFAFIGLGAILEYTVVDYDQSLYDCDLFCLGFVMDAFYVGGLVAGAALYGTLYPLLIAMVLVMAVVLVVFTVLWGRGNGWY